MVTHTCSSADRGIVALLKAAEDGDDGAVCRVLEDPNKRDSSQRTMLSLAAASGFLDTVERLLEIDIVNVNDRDMTGCTPLVWAAIYGQLAVVDRLLAVPHIEAQWFDTSSQQTPLHHAASCGFLGVVRRLLEVDGIEANCVDKERNTPLHLAARHGHLEIVDFLLQRDEVDVNCRNANLEEPLLICMNSTEVFNRLFQVDGVDTQCRDRQGKTLLHKAVLSGNITAIDNLALLSSFDVNCCDEDGKTPLHYAAWHGRTEVVKRLLIMDGVDACCRDQDEKTPLDLAVAPAFYHNTVNVVELLLQPQNADSQIQDVELRELLAQASKQDIRQLLTDRLMHAHSQLPRASDITNAFSHDFRYTGESSLQFLSWMTTRTTVP